jgi:hypothetical protein
MLNTTMHVRIANNTVVDQVFGEHIGATGDGAGSIGGLIGDKLGNL